MPSAPIIILLGPLALFAASRRCSKETGSSIPSHVRAPRTAPFAAAEQDRGDKIEARPRLHQSKSDTGTGAAEVHGHAAAGPPRPARRHATLHSLTHRPVAGTGRSIWLASWPHYYLAITGHSWEKRLQVIPARTGCSATSDGRDHDRRH
jgi:hypothetical protein